MADPNHVLVPHLHAATVRFGRRLEAMRRPYTAGEYLDLLNRAEAAVPGIGLAPTSWSGFR